MRQCAECGRLGPYHKGQWRGRLCIRCATLAEDTGAGERERQAAVVAAWREVDQRARIEREVRRRAWRTRLGLPPVPEGG